MAPAPEVDPSARTPAKRRGPKPKAYADRPFTPKPPVQRVERSYSKVKKQEVIMWLTHHRVRRLGEVQRPSFRDAEAHFKIPFKTIFNWWKLRGKLAPDCQAHLDQPATASASTPRDGQVEVEMSQPGQDAESTDPDRSQS